MAACIMIRQTYSHSTQNSICFSPFSNSKSFHFGRNLLLSYKRHSFLFLFWIYISTTPMETSSNHKIQPENTSFSSNQVKTSYSNIRFFYNCYQLHNLITLTQFFSHCIYSIQCIDNVKCIYIISYQNNILFYHFFISTTSCTI